MYAFTLLRVTGAFKVADKTRTLIFLFFERYVKALKRTNGGRDDGSECTGRLAWGPIWSFIIYERRWRGEKLRRSSNRQRQLFVERKKKKRIPFSCLSLFRDAGQPGFIYPEREILHERGFIPLLSLFNFFLFFFTRLKKHSPGFSKHPFYYKTLDTLQLQRQHFVLKLKQSQLPLHVDIVATNWSMRAGYYIPFVTQFPQLEAKFYQIKRSLGIL